MRDDEKTISTLLAKVAELEKVVQQQAAKIAELEKRLNKNSSNSSKPPSSDGLGKASQLVRRRFVKMEDVGVEDKKVTRAKR